MLNPCSFDHSFRAIAFSGRRNMVAAWVGRDRVEVLQLLKTGRQLQQAWGFAYWRLEVPQSYK
jgi:hypothetical protein